MSHPVLEITAGVVFTVALALGAMFVLPRPKPEPPAEEQRPPVESVLEVVPNPTIRIEPLPEKTGAERVIDLERKTERIAVEQRALIDEVRAATKAKRDK